MTGKTFFFIYLLYIILLFVAYRIAIKTIEKRKVKKKIEQEDKLAHQQGVSDV